MKTVVFSPAALGRLADVFACSLERFGEAYAGRLAGRLEALARGEGPKARPCEQLMRGVREASGLACFHEGPRYLILREKPEVLEVVEVF
ncbi:MAG: type II toxin-antitoxin system RelE/ParE family toxin, partial [Rhodospirillales bacterium]|nr:type II toxin-antitoxin system RelE/ParE family toxin [Rhodospirillales bacterium]